MVVVWPRQSMTTAAKVLDGGVLGAAVTWRAPTPRSVHGQARVGDGGRRYLGDRAGLMIRMMATEVLSGGVLEGEAATSYGEFDGVRKTVVTQQGGFVTHYGRSKCGSGVSGFGQRQRTLGIAVGSICWLSSTETEMVRQRVARTSSVSPLPPLALGWID
uniref:Uncharacterized protein n=1 Tax=Oryza rufipogon TaxID=4529 RepID=A0A0E0Q999_ORYRU